ncbi:MAG TPA: mannose-1-phosphate guanylyltransferase [Candidatus Binatia bacterium]|nr:mannose-1-phosphate guanylyltransferase [Candidatus Binatia bacterium]
MITVIIAGGSGTRLWPLSTPDYPKHLLKVNDDKLSLLQQTYFRAKRLSNKIYVVSEAGHIKHVKSQLPELTAKDFITEPARRGTANCVIAALAQISKHHDENEPIAFMAADHYIRDVAGFVHSFHTALNTTKSTNSIVLIGVEPSYPATGFGYIEKGEVLSESNFVFRVKSFREKPDFNTARTYEQSGNYLWNCSYFVGSLKAFLDAMTTYAPEMKSNYQKLKAAKTSAQFKTTYLSFEPIAVDYALIEKVKNLLVVPADFDWKDLGSFRDLAQAATGDASGNHIRGAKIETEAVQNSFIQNDETKPLAVIGLDNVVVVNTPHGLVVARKDLSQKIGDISKRF